jgi:hypothetical protein
MKIKSESGIALITTLLVLVLLGALLGGFVISVNSEQEEIGVDRGKNQAFYGSLAGLEKLTANLGTLFETNYSPTVAQLNGLTTTPPTLNGISFIAPDGGSGYRISYPVDAGGKPKAESRIVPSGPYEGLLGLITPYTITSTARTPGSAEVQMSRSLQTVAIPVFQFGIFSGPAFDFGGRVHTNGNLYLAQQNPSLTLRDKVTALGEIIRKNLINGQSTATYSATVQVATTPGTFRALGLNEGSLVGNIGSAQNEPTWNNLSINTYKGNIRNGRTGARKMDLPLVSLGATPVEIIRRPAAGEDTAKPELLAQRYFAMASLRILLSDTAAKITSLPTVTGTAPLALGIAATNQAAPDGTKYAVAGTPSLTTFRSTAGADLIGGFIKIEMQDKDRIWRDVTNEILGLGIAGRALLPTNSACVDQLNAIIRVQRFMDNPTNCDKTIGSRFWPNVLYDAREGAPRDSTSGADPYLGGVMHYIELDVTNLSKWIRGVIGTNGPNAINETGYVVYFSDRRTNQNSAGGNETAEYGFEDSVNSSIASGLPPNGVLESAEDVNGDGVQDLYGRTPIDPISSPLDATARPWNTVISGVARRNKAIFFRRALKLVNGSAISLGTSADGVALGLTVVAENPVYVQGNYNSDGTFTGSHVGSAIISDAITFLSGSWRDDQSFNQPHSLANRVAATTYYRAALISGKSKPFTRPTWGSAEDFGTDGGVHNFIRFLENWGGKELNYRGSIISMFNSRQAIGAYKCCTNVYSPPTRGYKFDIEFLQPSLLPPRTPMFRDINITGFTQEKTPK